MSQEDILALVMEELRDIKASIKVISEEQRKSAVSIAMLETMQKAIESLDLNGRLCKLENTVSTATGGGITLFQGATLLTAVVVAIAAVYGLKH